MKPELKIGFVDTFEGLADRFFIHALNQKYKVIRYDDKPDFLIFGDRNFGERNLSEQYNPQKVTRIFYTGENQRALDYKFHFAIDFDHFDNVCPNIHYRLPLYVLEEWKLTDEYKLQPLEGLSFFRQTINNNNGNTERTMEGKDGFCSFVNANPGCHKRNEFFHKLSEYKHIDSGGPLFNNIGRVIPRHVPDGTLKKIEFLKTKKFNLCFENGSYPGYVTEKLLHAYYAGTVPIYWGSETVEVDFNRDAFLNWHDYMDDDKFIERIKEVDENDILYNAYWNSPLLKNSQRNKYMNINRFLNWWNKNVYPTKAKLLNG